MPLSSFPRHVQIQTTTACGADCAICPHPRMSPTWTHGAMSDALFDEIVAQLSDQPVESVLPYLMADPLADKKIFSRIATLRRELPTARLEISTTGKYLVPAMREKLLAAPLSELRLSSHGLTAEEYARTMPGVNHERAMRNLRAFIEAWRAAKPFELNIVCLWGLWPSTREREIERFWADQGVGLSKWRVTSRSQRVDLTVFDEAAPDPTRFADGKRDGPYMCRFHRDTQWLHILSDGRVALCCMDYGQEEIVGDLRARSIGEIWASPRLAETRARIRGALPAGPPKLCRQCEWHVSEAVYEAGKATPPALNAECVTS